MTDPDLFIGGPINQYSDHKGNFPVQPKKKTKLEWAVDILALIGLIHLVGILIMIILTVIN